MYQNGYYKSAYLSCIENSLNSLGLSGYWLSQCNTNLNYTSESFKRQVKQNLQDQYIQNWLAIINTNELYYNYRIFKYQFEFEQYLTILPANLAHLFTKFRTLNHKLPVQEGRFLNIVRNERLCMKCLKGEFGDEFHYMFCCDYFDDIRKEMLKKYYYKYPNTIKFRQLFSSHNKNTLLKLCNFVRNIMMSV